MGRLRERTGTDAEGQGGLWCASPLRRGGDRDAVRSGWLAGGALAAGSFTTFESGQVRPLALSPDGTRLFAVNTPDDRLEIFDVDGRRPDPHRRRSPVGLEPVAVAARTDGEVWVVNHLSDSVSIVDVAREPAARRRARCSSATSRATSCSPAPAATAPSSPPRIAASSAPTRRSPACRARRSAAHHAGRRPRRRLGVRRRPRSARTLGGTPLAIVTLFGDTPRALAGQPRRQHASTPPVFKSGNQTTALSEGAVCNGCRRGRAVHRRRARPMPGGLPPPSTNCARRAARPETGLIVKFDTASRPVAGRARRATGTPRCASSLPDQDVFAIDADDARADGRLRARRHDALQHGGQPGERRASTCRNTEARNEVRFEGPGVFGGTHRAGPPRTRRASRVARRRERRCRAT